MYTSFVILHNRNKQPDYSDVGTCKVDGLNIARSGENLLVSMNIDVAGIDMPSSREVSFAPVLRAENNELFSFSCSAGRS